MRSPRAPPRKDSVCGWPSITVTMGAADEAGSNVFGRQPPTLDRVREDHRRPGIVDGAVRVKQ